MSSTDIADFVALLGIVGVECRIDDVIDPPCRGTKAGSALKACRFVSPRDGATYVIEEYVGMDWGGQDLDGTCLVLYREGERPDLIRFVVRGGNLPYAQLPVLDDGSVPEVLHYSLTSGRIVSKSESNPSFDRTHG